MKIYVDDIRPAPEGWIQARTVTDAIKTIARFGSEITEISLDHDISVAVSVGGEYRPFPSPETFQAVAYYMIQYYAHGGIKPKVTIHTANPVGGKELFLLLEDAYFSTEIAPASRVNRLESEV
jgi:hypothetical protein